MANKLMHGHVVLLWRVEVEKGLPTFVIQARNSHAKIQIDTSVMIPCI